MGFGNYQLNLNDVNIKKILFLGILISIHPCKNDHVLKLAENCDEKHFAESTCMVYRNVAWNDIAWKFTLQRIEMLTYILIRKLRFDTNGLLIW